MKQAFGLTVIFVVMFFSIKAQSPDEKEILQILHDQTREWNKGDLDNFMKGYWNNDSLMFVGSSGVTYGYQNTLSHYKETYNSADKMGKLLFDILKVKRLSNEYYLVLGKWSLKRNAGDASGHYTLIFRKITGKWKIVSDHSS